MKHPLQHLSKYSSLKALQLYTWSRVFPLKSRHLPHLRNLDISNSGIEALPEDISILYNLQTLNVSGCYQLCRLPRQLKYMTALRHLYTHNCPGMRNMPGDLGKLMSLQTLTCFVAGPAGSECSGVGELQQLNLGGELQIHQLENVTEEDAKAANLKNKKELRELSLRWTVGGRDDARVLEGLEPHDGLQATRIESYGGTTFPTWMAILLNMVEIHLSDCKKLQWLFSCGTSFTFPNLKEFTLQGLDCLEGLWETTNEEKDILFPQLEKLCVTDCPKLAMNAKWPKLTVLDFEGGEEELFLWLARYLTSLTNLKLQNRKNTETTSVAVGDHSYSTQVVNAREKWNHHDFPLAEMSLNGLKSGVTELCACFVQLQHLYIRDCAALVHWPEKEFQSLVSLRTLQIRYCKQLVGCGDAPAAEPSTVSEPSSQPLPHLKSLEIWGCESMVEIFKLPASLRNMRIEDCSKLKSIFSRSLQSGESASSILEGSPVHSEVTSPSAVARVKHFRFPCLEEILISRCDGLTGVLGLPPSLKEITVFKCCELRSVESHSGEFPSLESLSIVNCKSLSSLPDGPQSYASLRSLRIRNCPGIKMLPTGLQQCLSSLGYKSLDASYQDRLGSSSSKVLTD
ncbi:putative disease resistance protein RGA4 [Hordeum vulgare]|nr:putative disease resistance protein RGA4 [Hordeum vulgare]